MTPAYIFVKSKEVKLIRCDQIKGMYHLRSNDEDGPPELRWDRINLPYRFIQYLWWFAALNVTRFQVAEQAWRHICDSGNMPPNDTLDPDLPKLHQRVDSQQNAVEDRFINHPESEFEWTQEKLETVDNVFLGALAWIVLHETGQAELNHQDETIENEYAADDFATKCMIKWPDNPPRDAIRARIATAILAICALQYLEYENFSETTHPHAYKRLMRSLTLTDVKDNDTVLAFVAVNLRPQLAQLGASWEDEVAAGSLLQSVNYHVEKLVSLIKDRQAGS